MRYGALALLVALIWLGVAWIGVQRFPSRQVELARAGAIERAGGANRFFHERLPDAAWDAIVRPSTDLIYSILAYDLEDGPLELVFPPYDDYWTAQFVDLHTSSFAHVGSADGTTVPTRVMLADTDLPDADDVISASTPRGVILLRYLVRDPARDVPRVDALRREGVEVRPSE